MNKDFLSFFNTMRNDSLIKTEALFSSQRAEWRYVIAEQFQNTCAEIVNLQRESYLSALSYMEYTMLYSNFLNRRYIAEVWVYGDDWYCDKKQHMVGELDISFLFCYFDELWDKLLNARKRYAVMVTAQEVASVMLQTLPDFYAYLSALARFSVADCIDKEPFADILKNETFRVNVGDYMANTETVFVVNKNKDSEALIKRFKEQHEYDYTFEDYSALDFSNCSFKHTNFRYSQFRGSVFYKTSLDNSSLIGASFYKADMENCRLCNCLIYEADFAYAVLRNASFTFARGRVGLSNKKEWQHVGFLPVSFRYADLTDADFRWADLTGADFTGATLTGTDFTGALLEGAIFDDCIGKEG